MFRALKFATLVACQLGFRVSSHGGVTLHAELASSVTTRLSEAGTKAQHQGVRMNGSNLLRREQQQSGVLHAGGDSCTGDQCHEQGSPSCVGCDMFNVDIDCQRRFVCLGGTCNQCTWKTRASGSVCDPDMLTVCTPPPPSCAGADDAMRLGGCQRVSTSQIDCQAKYECDPASGTCKDCVWSTGLCSSAGNADCTPVTT
eukprot:TRINITY_DN51242_c0_g1_i1.p1 TRINITY_DN51242_c0_g1~~TRINITY_DN51242_c0_g1_i1.p1  ORF type:complete len:200 (+),score=33.22 TRINITY_DN51242_c0_g1_i1:99-698(+)